MDSRTFLDFLKVAERLKCNTRHSYTSSGRHESVAEHSWRLTMMAYFMRDEFPEADIDKVIRMCMFHDMGEAITGDIPAFEKTSADSDHENHVMDELLDTLPEPYRTDLKELFAEMEALETLEAKIYKALDKLEALIQHNEADLSTWIPLEYDLQMTYGTEECSFSEYMKNLRDMVREDSRKKAGLDK
nr:HD domain-containing protein [uncultured Blautia sp.]